MECSLVSLLEKKNLRLCFTLRKIYIPETFLQEYNWNFARREYQKIRRKNFDDFF